jgi:hypothetical protein
MGDPKRQVPFLAPVFASAMAPVAVAVRRAAMSALSFPAPVDVPCPRCESPCASWSPLTRQLYRRGVSLGTRSERVTVRCDRCGAGPWQTSGRAVGRNRHNGRPLLA